MTSTQRREKIISILGMSDSPISAGTLSRELSVTRQVIVGDIALLRAEGFHIIATPRGYISGISGLGLSRTVACFHSAADTLTELYLFVDSGCTVEDVTVEHPVYGQITASLHLSSRYDVEQFMEKMASTNAAPLSMLTEGIHLHRITCPGEDAFKRLLTKLRELGILVSE